MMGIKSIGIGILLALILAAPLASAFNLLDWLYDTIGFPFSTLSDCCSRNPGKYASIENGNCVLSSTSFSGATYCPTSGTTSTTQTTTTQAPTTTNGGSCSNGVRIGSNCGYNSGSNLYYWVYKECRLGSWVSSLTQWCSSTQKCDQTNGCVEAVDCNGLPVGQTRVTCTNGVWLSEYCNQNGQIQGTTRNCGAENLVCTTGSGCVVSTSTTTVHTTTTNGGTTTTIQNQCDVAPHSEGCSCSPWFSVTGQQCTFNSGSGLYTFLSKRCVLGKWGETIQKQCQLGESCNNDGCQSKCQIKYVCKDNNTLTAQLCTGLTTDQDCRNVFANGKLGRCYGDKCIEADSCSDDNVIVTKDSRCCSGKMTTLSCKPSSSLSTSYLYVCGEETKIDSAIITKFKTEKGCVDIPDVCSGLVADVNKELGIGCGLSKIALLLGALFAGMFLLSIMGSMNR